MLHTLTMLLDNQPGALSRVVGLFSQRGYNIHSLNVAPIRDGSLSRLTLVVDEPDKATIVDSTETNITVQLGGAPDFLDRVLSSFSDFEITEVARSGLSAISKGTNFLEEVDYRTTH